MRWRHRDRVYPSPGNAGGSGATQAGWSVAHVEAMVDELTAKGVTFEQYGAPINTDAKGVARFGEYAGEWFKDPDGKVLRAHGLCLELFFARAIPNTRDQSGELKITLSASSSASSASSLTARAKPSALRSWSSLRRCARCQPRAQA